ncbi:ISL3 family transposase [Egbenema bharatensis]|uniref:ISL3 family transposase n=1 Tax=Egbenema bharatensis TaxID=3463334 RepID=UPI003A86DA24
MQFILLKNGKDLTPEETKRLASLLKRSKRLAKAYQWKEEFRAIYEQSLTVEEGKRQIQEWLNKARAVYSEAIKTIRNHLDGISNYFRNRTTSGAMEGINNRRLYSCFGEIGSRISRRVEIKALPLLRAL